MPFLPLSTGPQPSGGMFGTRSSGVGAFLGKAGTTGNFTHRPGGWVATSVTLDLWTVQVNTNAGASTTPTGTQGTLTTVLRVGGVDQSSAITMTGAESCAVGGLSMIVPAVSQAMGGDSAAFDVDWRANSYRPLSVPTALLHYTAATSATSLLGIGQVGSSNPLMYVDQFINSEAFFYLPTWAMYDGIPGPGTGDDPVPWPAAGVFRDFRVVTVPGSLSTGFVNPTSYGFAHTWALRVDSLDVAVVSVSAATDWACWSSGDVASVGIGGNVSLVMRKRGVGSYFYGAFLCTFTAS